MKKIKDLAKEFMLVKNVDGARSILLATSFLIGIVSLMHPESVDRTMQLILEPFMWSMLFLAYSGLVAVNIKKANGASYPEACIGFLIWSITFASICVTAKTIPIIAVPFIILVILSWWILIRVGVKHG